MSDQKRGEIVRALAAFLNDNREVLVGGFLFVLGAGLTILLAFLAGAEEPPSQSTQALLVLLAILAQAGAARMFYGRGKADPSHAKRSTARLINLARRARSSEEFAQQIYETKPVPTEIHRAVGIISTDLSWIQEGLIEAYEDWRVFHPDVSIQELEDGNGNTPD